MLICSLVKEQEVLALILKHYLKAVAGCHSNHFEFNLQFSFYECNSTQLIFSHQIQTNVLVHMHSTIPPQVKNEWQTGKMSRVTKIRANFFCASLLHTTARANSHATSCIERACQVLKWTMIGQMAIAIALLEFNDLGRSVTPAFLFRNSFCLQLFPHCSKMNKKLMWEVKKISRFLSTGHGILLYRGCKARETLVSKCKLNLRGTSPVD